MILWGTFPKPQEFRRMTDNKIIYNIVAYLDSLTTSLSSEEEKANVAKAASLLESTFGISLSSPEDFKALSFYPQLLPLDNKLTKTYLDIESNISLDSNASKKFQVFYDAVKAKGYYNDENGKELDESSIEYLKRHSKLLQKFQDSMSVSTPTMAASSAPTASLDEKSKLPKRKRISETLQSTLKTTNSLFNTTQKLSTMLEALVRILTSIIAIEQLRIAT